MVHVRGVEIEGVLGRGASSTVYLGRQDRFDRRVAVKVIDLAGRDAMAAKLFANECRVLGRLTGHPNIVTVLDAGLTEDQQPYLVVEYLPGGTLADTLDAEGRFTPERAVAVGIRLAGALETAHRNGVVHGDVKPQNVLWTPAGEPALVDFGVALLAGSAATSRLQVLTPLHAAPEQLDGVVPGPSSDVYGLASTLFELLDGRPAYGDGHDSPLEVIARITRHERRDLDRSVVPAAIADVVDRGLAFEAEDRPATMADFGDMLRAAAIGEGMDPPTMVVIDALPSGAEGSDGSSDGGLLDTFAGGDGSGGAYPDGPQVDGPTLEPPRRGRNRRALAGLSAAVLLVAGAAVAFVATSGDSDAGDGPAASVLAEEVAPDPSAGTGANDGTAPVTTGSATAGIQRDTIDYDLPDVEDESPRLDTALQDTSAIFGPLDPAGPPTVVEIPQLPVDRTPARLQYEAYNQAKTPECRAFLSRELVLTGLWVRVATTSQTSMVNTVVLAFEDEEMASEALVSFSLEQGPTTGECRGFRDGGSGVLDYDELDIVHRDPPLVGLPAGTRYNSWLRLAEPVGDVHAFSLNTVSQRDRFLVLYTHLTTKETGPPDPATASGVIADVLSRL